MQKVGFVVKMLEKFVPVSTASAILVAGFMGFGGIMAVDTSSADASQITMYAVKGYGSGADRGEVVILPNPSDTSDSFLVGNPANGIGITGLDFDNDGNLWASSSGQEGVDHISNLIRVDPDGGGLLEFVGQIHTNAANVLGSTIAIGDLAYNPADDKLYGIDMPVQSTGGGGDIYTIDLGTGLATFVGSTIWGTNAGIAFDNTGTLFALGWDPNEGPFGQNMLFTLSTTDASELSRVAVSLNDNLFTGLGINPATNEIFATEDDFFGSGTQTGNVFSVDALTGNMTFLGKPSGVVSDIAFRVPEPGTLAVLGLGLLGLAYARRRRAG